MERFWGACFVLLIILYGSQAISGDFDEAYNQKVILSSYAVVGEIDNIFDSSKLEAESYNKSYEKASLVAAIEDYKPSLKKLTAGNRRTIASAFGETDLRYHIKLKSGNFVPTTLDFSTNILYNYSYIVNTPSKLLHNIKTDFAMEKEFAGSGALIREIGTGMKFTFLAWDILHAITGLGVAFVMLFVGCFIGLLFHPIDSVVNFFPVLWNLCVTTWHAISYIFNLFK
ncbi:hypothetical protein [Cohnella abietis]|uniref:Uncharacterized protein n=1 Tax=Cohnella abietis TaxID=2507935 RepID=A0A3T1CZM1_9BACL|nr:hypothetical protein [Cohnella abietis]BBI31251.1 hypothetical protein KCTCHS21_06500 [Cohnella abietis]